MPQPLQHEVDTRLVNPQNTFSSVPRMPDERHGKPIGADIHLGYAVHHHNLPVTSATLRNGSSAPRIETNSLGGLPLRKPMTPQKRRRILRMLTIAAAKRQHRLTSTPRTPWPQQQVVH